MASRIVTIEVNAQAGQYQAEVKRIQEINSRLYSDAQRGAAQTIQAAQQLTQSYTGFASTTSGVIVKQRELGSAINIVTSQIGGLNQVANLAANAITAIATAGGATAIALGALTVAMGLFAYRIEQARERLRQLAEVELANLNREIKALNIENDIKRQLAVLRSVDSEIEAIRQKYEELRIAAEKAGARPQAIAAIDEIREREIGNILRKRSEDRAKALEQEQKALEAKAEAEQKAFEAEQKTLEAARSSLVGQIEAQRAQVIAFNEGEEAALLYRIAILSSSEAVKKLGEEGEQLLKILRDEQLELLKAKQAAEEHNKVLDEIAKEGQLAAQIERIQNEEARARLRNLRDTSIDVAGEVARAVTDITSSLIQGTLRWADIGRSILASFARVALEYFTNIIKTAQTANAVVGGGAGMTGGGAAVGGQAGGILSPLSTIFSGLSSIFTTPFGLGAGGAGAIPTSLGGLTTTGMVAYGLSRLFGLNKGGQIGSIVGSLGGTLLASTATGGAIAGSIGSAVGSAAGGLFGAAGGTAIGSLVGTYIFPVIGTIIGAIIGGLISAFTGKKNPTAVLGAQFSGINYNQAAGQFDMGDIAVFVRRTADLSGRRAYQVANEVQNILTPLASQWTEMLNIFPSVIREQMVPALDETNRILNDSFRRLKFSEGGSRNIAQELAALGGPANVAFVSAFRAPISVGFAKSLERAGFGGQELNYSNLANLAPAGAEFLAKELTNLATTFGTLGGISPRGITQFLSGLDIGNIQSLLDQFYAISDVLKIPFAIQDLIPQLQPFIDYLSSAVQESSNLFGRGLIAAMEAATESDARLSFMNSLGTGIKDRVFQGLTEAFIASAEFTDLLAPIQQQIRAFTEEAILSGSVPDIARFRQAILPAIEQITTRAELLEPLIDALQELGFDIREMLGLLPEAAEPPPPAPPAVVNISINTNNPDEIGRKIGEILGGKLPPPVF